MLYTLQILTRHRALVTLVSTITGNSIQYGGSLNEKKYKDKSFESLELAIVGT